MKDIIRMARESGWIIGPATLSGLTRFAALVLANRDPQSSMSWQEGNEAGRLAEREACYTVAKFNQANHLEHLTAEQIRARGETK